LGGKERDRELRERKEEGGTERAREIYFVNIIS
jgi:hypothetical protein